MSKASPRPAKTPQVVPLEYAGKWLAWSSDGLRIVAVAPSFEACVAEAARAGFPEDQVAISRVPVGRLRGTDFGA